MQMLRLDEVFAALKLLYLQPLHSNLDSPLLIDMFPRDELVFCDEILEKVSRSFAAVIRQLPPSLLVDILVFYLVLRALDTIEDDTHAFDGSHEVKISHLLAFHKTALQDKLWKMSGVGQGDERRLLENFPKVHAVYRCLSTQSQGVIADITQRMATGMAEFVSSDLGQGTNDIAQYNRYCHFVAGLVGEGLSRLFVASGMESPSLASELHLSDQMGLFLQKTNIIRDYLYVRTSIFVCTCVICCLVRLISLVLVSMLHREDYIDKRAFWPQSVWKKYSSTGELGFFAQQLNPTARERSLECLNELVTDALELVPDCLAYMSKLQHREVFRFCAIPQVMAIATLEKCYNNPDVFTGVVKIRKGLSCKLIIQTETLDQVHVIFNTYATAILLQAPLNDPSYKRTVRACEVIQELTELRTKDLKRQRFQSLTLCVAVPAIAALAASKWTGYSEPPHSFVPPLSWLGIVGILSCGVWYMKRL
jgi:farnesyl-diphosphate farnesyltransferase